MKQYIYCLLLAIAVLPFQACTKLSSDSSTEAPLENLETLPAQNFAKVNIATAGGVDIVSKDDYVAGTVTIDPNGTDDSYAFSAPMKIKGRGNSTWHMPKKPFKIKLDATSAVMGMPADKEWVLLANYSDKTLMRNILGFELGRRLGMAYVPRWQIVEVNLNGTELGTYLLTEQVKISPVRVNAIKTDVTGGYLLELDQRRDEPARFETTRGVPYAIKEPSSPKPEEATYISGFVQTVEDVLNSPTFADPATGYAQYIDVDSFVNWYLVSEILKNQDSASFSSIFLFKSSGQKLKLGPLWDFDLAAGNVDYSDAQYPERWWVRVGSPWFTRLLEDPAFAAKVKTRWNQLKGQGADLTAVLRLVDRTAYALELSQQKNFVIWDILNIYVWPNPVVTGSYQGEVSYLKDWLTTRMKWMDQQFNP